MTVPKSKRRETKMQFVHNARLIEDYCIRHWNERISTVLQECIRLAAKIYNGVTIANSIYPDKDNQLQAEERILYLKRALATTYALKMQISLATRHQLIDLNISKEINELIEREKILIKGIIKKDKERYRVA